MATATVTKFRVRAGNTLLFGTTDKDGKLESRSYGPGEEVELTEAQAKSSAHAIEKPGAKGKPKTLAERRLAAEKELSEIARLEAEQNRRSRKSDPGRAAAEESIRLRPDNAASGIPSVGRIPAGAELEVERAEEAALGRGETSEAEEHGFAREGSAGTRGEGTRAEGTRGEEEADEAQYAERLDGNAADLIAEANNIDDADELKALIKAEKKGKNRTTVIAAYEKRVEELKS